MSRSSLRNYVFPADRQQARARDHVRRCPPRADADLAYQDGDGEEGERPHLDGDEVGHRAGYRDDDPAGDAVSAALPKNAGRREHHRALPHAEVGAAVQTVRESGASPATKLAFEFLVLTAARTGEVREARWDEICGATWTVPAERMKMNREHRVPLSNRAVEVLDEARALMDGSGPIFPSPTGRGPLSNGTVVKLLRELGVKAVPHGFRSSFRDWAAETGQRRELAEQALAHSNPNKVEAAYARSDLLQQRAALMEAWAQYAITSSGWAPSAGIVSAT